MSGPGRREGEAGARSALVGERDERDERGAALLMVLLLVAVMSVVAVGVVDKLIAAGRRSANVAAHDQASWYLIGAEELAMQTLRRSRLLDPDRTTLQQPWAAGRLEFPIDGGRIEGEIFDATNCFNVNALANESGGGGSGGYGVDADERALLLQLLELVEAPALDPRGFADALADWLDSDSQAAGRGAEDYDYALAHPPYRAANTLMAEIEEARALEGLGEGAFRVLRRYLCARPQTGPVAVNPNTLELERAELLAMVFEGALSVDQARQVLRERPARGWSSVDDFLDEPQIRAVAAPEGVADRIVLRSSFFELRARVYYLDAFVAARSLMSAPESGRIEVLRRRFGTDE